MKMRNKLGVFLAMAAMMNAGNETHHGVTGTLMTPSKSYERKKCKSCSKFNTLKCNVRTNPNSKACSSWRKRK